MDKRLATTSMKLRTKQTKKKRSIIFMEYYELKHVMLRASKLAIRFNFTNASIFLSVTLFLALSGTSSPVPIVVRIRRGAEDGVVY
ncbi:MAG: hypothetical protein JEZ14_08925 [Marinilabiliaceae bacterium]|nr:hypothetical protein [Marinilabiliaceae bacterium]